jgi:hypothetical protein
MAKQNCPATETRSKVNLNNCSACKDTKTWFSRSVLVIVSDPARFEWGWGLGCSSKKKWFSRSYPYCHIWINLSRSIDCFFPQKADAIYVAEQTTGIVQNLLQKRIKTKLPDKFYMLNRTREWKELIKVTLRYAAWEVSYLYCVSRFTHDSGSQQTQKFKYFLWNWGYMWNWRGIS